MKRRRQKERQSVKEMQRDLYIKTLMNGNISYLIDEIYKNCVLFHKIVLLQEKEFL